MSLTDSLHCGGKRLLECCFVDPGNDFVIQIVIRYDLVQGELCM